MISDRATSVCPKPVRFAAIAGLAAIFAGASLPAQDAPPPAAPAPEPQVSVSTRAPEGPRIINLPSADLPAAGTLGMLFTHRFAQPLEESDWHSLLSFDSGADIGIGIFYVPVRNLEISVDRSSNQDDWEIAAKYRLLERSHRFPLSFALRAGTDIRTEIRVNRENSYFAQGIASLAIGPRVRLSAIPTYLSQTAGTPFLSEPQEDVFNVLGALSIAVTRSINVQGEVTPRRGRFGSRGTGWIAAIEKTVLRHRFSFTVGNVRTTTVDQYTAPEFVGFLPEDYFIGFNLARQWKLK